MGVGKVLCCRGERWKMEGLKVLLVRGTLGNTLPAPIMSLHPETKGGGGPKTLKSWVTKRHSH